MSRKRAAFLGAITLIALLLISGCSGLLPFGDQATDTPTITTEVTETPAATAQSVAATPATTPTLAATPVPTETPENCWNAAFIADGTIPDGTWVKPGVTFQKVWRVRNDGVCPWQGVVLQIAEGNPMNSPTIVVPEVAPGATTDITATLTAPVVTGDYRSEWRYTAGETSFDMLTVVIKVSPDEPRPGLIPPLPTLPPLPPLPRLP